MISFMFNDSSIKNFLKLPSRDAWYCVGGFMLGFAIFFRAQIMSYFDVLFGDRGDTRFAIFIHEHIFRAMLGRNEFLSPPFFYNVTRTLGFSDAYLLNQVIYAPLRCVGVDPFLALLLTIMILSIVCYGFLYALLRRFGHASKLAAMLCAFLFTFANNLYVNANHLQLFAVYYVPVASYLTSHAVTKIHTNKGHALLAAGFAGLLCSLLFTTSFYIAWFLGLSALVFSATFVLLARDALRAWFVTDPIRLGMLGFAFFDGFILGLIPFVFTYTPVYLGGARHFREYLQTAPTFIDIANVGQNFIWGQLFEKIGLVHRRTLGSSEQAFALTPVLQLLVVISMLVGLQKRCWGVDLRDQLIRAATVAAGAVYIILFFLIIKVHEQSLFLALYRLVPGAGAIRAGYRAMIVANFFAVISVGLAVSRVMLILSQDAVVNRKSNYAKAMLYLLLMLSMAEQINFGRTSSVSRTFETARLKDVPTAPPECRSFYIANEPGQPAVSIQIDAMLVAQKAGIPTINGYSGVFPVGWKLYVTADKNYEHNVKAWAESRGIISSLCRFELDRKVFTKAH